MIKLEIKQNPISINQMTKGKKYHTDEYAGFLYTASLELKKQRQETLLGKLEISIILHLVRASTSDIDNRIKCILDACTYARVWNDDSQIYKMSVEKKKSKENMVEIVIKNL
jgi:Holliday junction resolvase RusA-like endonuclease